ncbi:MAG: cytochrome c3 family protein, partial [Chloroflexota bacterium]
SIHGLRLIEGDPNVATCFDCHGDHQILKANDPASTVYAANVPAMCAGCHADQELMAAYDIPTNQFELYRQSVHGHALLDNQDFRAPNCATCHGTHGAAPPGFEEVANVCGGCHTATQDHYLKSPHASAGAGAPKCVTCHGRYDVDKPSEALYLGAESRHCGECHTADSVPGQVAQSLYDSITTAARAYDEAGTAVQVARGVGMLVAPMEGRLREANTHLITARAAQHTLDLDIVREQTEDVQATADEVKAAAEAAVAESIFRRRAMVIAVAAIALTIVALYLLKRELDRRLEADS